MNGEVLTAALTALNAAGIPAEEAYPGKTYTAITAPRAAVHIHSAQPGEGKMVLEVTVLTPKSDGGVAGERLALTAMAALEAVGGSCSQSGCSYNGLLRAYSTGILAAFTRDVGFSVFLGDTALEYAVEFTSEEKADAQLCYVMGVADPQGVSRGPVSWNLTVTERIPLEAAEIPLPQGETQVRVVREGGTETFSGCVWTQVQRTYASSTMVRRITAIAKAREGA